MCGVCYGDFVFTCRNRFDKIALSGMDIDAELLQRAQEEVAGVTFLQGDIAQAPLPEKFDVIFQNGVRYIFDDFVWLDNLLSSVTDNGRLFIFGLFNPEDLDISLNPALRQPESK